MTGGFPGVDQKIPDWPGKPASRGKLGAAIRVGTRPQCGELA